MLIDLQAYTTLGEEQTRYANNADFKTAYNWLRHTKTTTKAVKVDCQVYYTVLTTKGTKEAMPWKEIEATNFRDVYYWLCRIQQEVEENSGCG